MYKNVNMVARTALNTSHNTPKEATDPTRSALNKIISQESLITTIENPRQITL